MHVFYLLCKTQFKFGVILLSRYRPEVDALIDVLILNIKKIRSQWAVNMGSQPPEVMPL